MNLIDLVDAVVPALEKFDELPEEHDVEAIYHTKGFAPKFVQIGKLANEVSNSYTFFFSMIV